MGNKQKLNPLKGEIHPAVIEAAGLNCVGPEALARIAGIYRGRNYHPLPTYFAEMFHQWTSATEEERKAQIEIEESDPIGGKFTPLGTELGDGILGFRETFTRACSMAVTVGDREFFRVFDEVCNGLARDEFTLDFSALVVSAREFLVLCSDGDSSIRVWNAEVNAYEEKLLIAGQIPTIREISNYLELVRGDYPKVKWPMSNPIDNIRKILNDRGLVYAGVDRPEGGKNKERN